MPYILALDAGSDAPQLLHVCADAQQEAQVHAERANVGAGLAGHPKDGQVLVLVKLDQLLLVDCADAQLALDGADQRRPLGFWGGVLGVG